MAGPYVSSRSGRLQWMMQRVSAVLLLFLAFLHFGIQHFTPDAVSTGLTVVARMNDPYWQAYYIVFIVLAMYHGINGLIGICYDYAPKPLTRGIAAMVLWSLGIYFAVLGLTNVFAGPSLADAKTWYAENGFAKGSSMGSPPSFPVEFDLRQEKSETAMLGFYLTYHVGGIDEQEAVKILGTGDPAAVGDNIDTWALGVLKAADGSKPLLTTDKADGIFVNEFEFASWALNVRKVNNAHRLAEDDVDTTREQSLQTKLAGVTGYSPY